MGFRLVTREALEQVMRAEYGVEPPAWLSQPMPERRGANPPPQGNGDGRGAGENGSGSVPAGNGNGLDGGGRRFAAQAAEICLYADMAASIAADLATREHILLVGCGGQMLFTDAGCALHLRVVAPRAWRAARVAAELCLAPPAAAQLVVRRDALQARYMRAVFGSSGAHSQLYHLVINTAALDFGPALEAALVVMEGTQIRHAGLLSAETAERIKLRSKIRLAHRFADLPGSPLLEHVPFAHPSERVFARLMDFYGIDWEYESRTFPLEWNDRNEVAEAFTPDFYLPEMDLYVELTTMKQSLVTRKNRKVKRLRQLYPDINIRVFYQKDVEDLIFKLGAAQTARFQV
jgi:cytidylate kinase